jgi:hypothetical protein
VLTWGYSSFLKSTYSFATEDPAEDFWLLSLGSAPLECPALDEDTFAVELRLILVNDFNPA